MIRRPEIDLRNYKEVYDYYEQHEQSKTYARLAHFAISKLYKPQITNEDGVGECVEEEVQKGSRFIVSGNHLTADDQYVIVSVAEKMKELNRFRGNTFIPTEPSLFSRSGLTGKMLRRAVDGLGAIPTFRLEDLKRQGIEITEEINEMYQDSLLLSSKVHVSKLLQGSHMAGFWSGSFVQCYRIASTKLYPSNNI